MRDLRGIFSFGIVPGLDPEQRAGIVVINSICIAIIFIVLVLNTFIFSLLGSHSLGSLLLVPLLLLILYFNARQWITAARFTFYYGLLLAFFVLALYERRVGLEYAMIAIACSSTFVFSENKWVIGSFLAACLVYVAYWSIDQQRPFLPDPSVNYTVTSACFLVVSGSVVFSEMLISRSIIRKYSRSLKAVNEKLYNINDELNSINEGLDMAVRKRTEELETKTEELEAQKEKLNELVVQLDRKNVELKEAVQELQFRNYEMDQIIYRLSHNLKAPLCSIGGLINLMKVDPQMGLIEGALPKIDQKIQEMENVFRTVSSLTFVNLVNKVEITTLSLSELVKEAVHNLRNMQGAKTMTISIDDHEQLIHTDREMILNVFYHIIRNAIMFRAKDRHNHLHISFEQSEEESRVIFTDNGIGISDRIKDKLFDMFFQGSDQSKGAGLGLYISRVIMRKLKGDVTLESEGVNRGVRVTVTIPRKANARILRNEYHAISA